MLAPEFSDRVSRLIQVRLEERRREFPRELIAIAHRLSARGLLKSSVHVQESQRAHERELEVRGILIWESIVRIHRTLGSSLAPILRDELKALFKAHLGPEFSELAASFEAGRVRSGMSMSADLAEAKARVFATHDVEIDLYVDSLGLTSESAPPVAASYNFYGNVGAVQTGAHAVANTVQNLGAEDVAALRSAIEQVREAIASAASVPDKQRAELLELATDVHEQLSRPDGNGTRMLATLNVLATAVQGIASAQPAYAAIRAALLPLGVTLP